MNLPFAEAAKRAIKKWVEGRLEELKEMVDVVERRLIDIEDLLKKKR